MDEYSKVNQATWNTWARYHVRSKFYEGEAGFALLNS